MVTPASLSLADESGRLLLERRVLHRPRRVDRCGVRDLDGRLAAVLRELLVEQRDVEPVGATRVDDPERARSVLHVVAAVLGLLLQQVLAHELRDVDGEGRQLLTVRHRRWDHLDLRRLHLACKHVTPTALRERRGVEHRERLLGDHRHGIGALRGFVGAGRLHELVLDRAPPRLPELRRDRVLVDHRIGRQPVLAGRVVLDAAVRRRAVLVGRRDQHDHVDAVGGDALRGRAAVLVAFLERAHARWRRVPLHFDPLGLGVAVGSGERGLRLDAGSGSRRARGARLHEQRRARDRGGDGERPEPSRTAPAHDPGSYGRCHRSPLGRSVVARRRAQIGSGSPMRA